MADFEEALNSLLSDPDAMGQIMALAGQLGGGQPDSSPEPESPPSAASLPDLSSLLDPSHLTQMGALLELFQSGGQVKEEAAALLAALRPFLQADKQRKLDRALKLAGLSQTAKKAYALWKEGELHL